MDSPPTNTTSYRMRNPGFKRLELDMLFDVPTTELNDSNVIDGRKTVEGFPQRVGRRDHN